MSKQNIPENLEDSESPKNALVKVQTELTIPSIDVQGVVEHLNKIKELMSRVMVRDVHYGRFFEDQKRDSLLKAGAEKLALAFGLTAKFTGNVEPIALPENHREYNITCDLYQRKSGAFIAQGVGSCSTLEIKYHYRWTCTFKEIPHEYWKTKNPLLLGGLNFKAGRYKNGKWYIFTKELNQDVAEVWNTVLKMGKKRAFVDAVINALGVSDMFTQDVEDKTDTDPDQNLIPIEQEEVPPEYADEQDQTEKSTRITAKDVQYATGAMAKISTEKRAGILAICKVFPTKNSSRDQYQKFIDAYNKVMGQGI